MPEVFATTLKLHPKSGHSAGEGFLAALKIWVSDRWPSDQPWFALGEGGSRKTSDGSIFRWEPFTAADRLLLEFTWRHDHLGDPSISWSTRATVYGDPESPALSLRVSNTGPDPGEPGALLTSRPRLVLELLEHFNLTHHGLPCSLRPMRLTANKCMDFITHALGDSDRTRPILLLTPDERGSFAVRPEALAREFLTLAELWMVPDPDTTYALTDAIGNKELSVFHGAARLYMPGFSTSAEPLQHPLLLPRRLATRSERMRLAEYLALQLAEDFSEDHAVHRLRDERAIWADERSERIAAALHETRQAANTATEWQNISKDMDEENRSLQQDLAAARSELEDARRTIDTLQFALSRRKTSETTAPRVAIESLSFDSVFAAVEAARVLLADDLMILDSALEAAANSPFARPVEVFSALRAAAEIARARRAGPLGKSLRDAFRVQGQDYRQGISQTSSKKIRQQHRFTHAGSLHVCEEHLVLGSGTYDPTSCLRVYLSSAKRPDGRIVIGHVGRHLDVVTTT